MIDIAAVLFWSIKFFAQLMRDFDVFNTVKGRSSTLMATFNVIDGY
jgi:hypothetical protein